MSRVNLQSLAKELGLSVATVSKALKDSYEISIETKGRVLALARQLNYTPNPYASSLRRKRSNTIAVVVPEVADSFFSQAIRGIEEVAQSKGYHVLIYLTYESSDKERKILEDCQNGRVDGVLLSVSSQTDSHTHIEHLMDYNIPVVLFDRVLEKAHTSKITTDDYDSAYRATAHLAECNCQQLAYLSISDQLEMNNHRIHGFRQALADRHFSPEACRVIHCTNDTATAHTIIQQLLASPNRPDGIVASVEKLAPPVYAICHALHINIPAQLKLVCFSNTSYAPVLQPALTTVTQPATEMGKAAATILFKTLKNSGGVVKPEQVVLPSALQVRASTSGMAT
jgi:LacI family transcriptional regulator